MAIKLSELYDSVKDQEIKLVAGKNGLNNIVRWVHMVESLEISVFLHGQEIAFTTGIGLENKEDLFNLVKHTYNNNASGMVINIGPFIDEISNEIIEFCNENDFPIFEVPWHVYMAEIMRDFCYNITISDRINTELSNAIKNAIFFQSQQELYLPQLERHNFNSNWSYCLAVIETRDKDSKKVVDSKRRAKILKNLENTLAHTSKRSFVFELDGRFVLVFAKYSEEKIKDIVELTKKRCNPILRNNEEIYFGVGKSTKNAKCIAKSYKRALDVLKLQKSSNSNEIIMYRQLGLYKLLLSIDDKEIVNEYYQETLEPLIKHDQLSNTDYLEVLDSYIKNDCCVKDVAEQLFYHRNTINYKLNKIQEILSCDLSKLNTRLIYSISLMLNNIN
ncbi:PucR family transcriptional regulator ligand-binding domain-containing protein [uncultured Ilyobacter sp.]|uniref:PucR family transcriptional regulator n=1 Tax=uncultured Ilyobacter sp. TaxID=544433 RepID=UPI0029C01E19|nr:PucR family transcriptional regulator ligand-binding domain-containing protein [uncultured Ilyobacter sp.]